MIVGVERQLGNIERLSEAFPEERGYTGTEQLRGLPLPTASMKSTRANTWLRTSAKGKEPGVEHGSRTVG